MDAFHTADRRQRGHPPYDRVFEIYSLDAPLPARIEEPQPFEGAPP